MSYYSLLLLTISFGLLFNLPLTCVAQNACKGNNVDVISTDPDNPNSPVRSNWDWRKPLRYTIWTSQTKSIKVPNPFNGGGTGISNTNLNHFQSDYYDYDNKAIDFHPEGGWELLIKKFGYDKYGNVSGEDRPFLAFYNRYTGKIRVFLLIIDEPQTAMNGAQIKMTYKNNATGQESALFANAKPISSSVINFPQDHQVQSPSYYSNEDEYWIYAEFATAFDPCACMYKSNIRFNFDLLEKYELQLFGEINGKITEIVDRNNNVQTGNGFKSNFTYAKKAFKEGKKGYKSGKDFKNEAQKFIDSNAGFIKDKIGLQIDDLKQFSKGIPYVSAAVNVYDFLMGGGKQNAQNKDFHPMAFEAGLNFKGDGSLRSLKPYKNQEFATPGSRPNKEPDGKFYPYYNHLLGVFNLLEPPKLKYVDYKQDRRYARVYIPGQGLTYVDVQHFPNIRQFKPSDKLKYVLNPAAGLKIKELEAAIQYKIDSNFTKNNGWSGFNDSGFTDIPKPVEFGKPWDNPVNIEERFNTENFEIALWPQSFPENEDMITLRSRYVPISCFKNQSLFVYVPEESGDNIKGVDINLKIKAKLIRKDGKGQNVLLVRTFDFMLEEKGTSTVTEYSFEAYQQSNKGSNEITGYPKYLKHGNIQGPLMKTPLMDIENDIFLHNQVVENDHKAYEKIEGKDISIKSGNALRAGEKIIIKGTTSIQSNILLTTNGPIPSCGEPNDQYQATQEELQTFCNSQSYQDHIQLAKKGLDNNKKPNDKESIPIKANIAPNPVQKMARLGFSLPQSSHVQINIKGVSGQTVRKNIVSRTFGKGPQRVRINMRNLKGGFYICVIQTRFGRKTLKFVKQ